MRKYRVAAEKRPTESIYIYDDATTAQMKALELEIPYGDPYVATAWDWLPEVARMIYIGNIS